MPINNNDFTGLLGNIYSELDVGFKNLHTREELEKLIGDFKRRIETNRKANQSILNTTVMGIYGKIKKYIGECNLSEEDKIKYNSIDLTRLRAEKEKEKEALDRNNDDYDKKLKSIENDIINKIKEYVNCIKDLLNEMPSIKDFDKIFMTELVDKFIKNNAPSSVDYLNRTVLRRLTQISPEFVCKKGSNGDNVDVEGYIIDNDGNRILKEDLPSTRLLILKQFIKVFTVKKSEECNNDIDSAIFSISKDNIEDLSENIFNCMNKEEYVKIITKVQATIRYKANYVKMDPELLNKLKKIIVPEVLSDAAKNSTAKILSDCFLIDEKDIKKFGLLNFEETVTIKDLEEIYNAFNLAIVIPHDKKNEYEKISRRYNDATKTNRTDNLFVSNKRKLNKETKEQLAVRVLLNKITDFSNAKFSGDESTREFIYIFSIAFKMTFSVKRRANITSNESDYYTDIRKNLFFDYYCENLMNFFTDNGTTTNMNEVISGGYGPNVRNFAEVIYIYIINRKDFSEIQKLQHAKNLIKECQNDDNAKSSSDFIEMMQGIEENQILNYRLTSVIATCLEKVIKYDEQNFKEYLLENYECKTDINEEQEDLKPLNANIMELSTEHISAVRIYRTLAENTKSIVDEKLLSTNISHVNEENNDSKTINLLADKFKRLRDNEISIRNIIKEEHTNPYYLTNSKKTNYDDNMVCTRSNLLFLLSDRIILNFNHLSESDKAEKTENFENFYNFFRSESYINSKQTANVDRLLIYCGFQEICSKNIFDLMLIYSTYKKCAII